MPIMPPSWSVRNSSSLPRPSKSGRATLVASNSSHSSEPARRSRRHRLRTVQRPGRKSNSSPALTAYPASCIAPLSLDVRGATLAAIEGDLRPLCLLDCAACSRRPRACSSCSRCCRRSRSRPARDRRSGSASTRAPCGATSRRCRRSTSRSRASAASAAAIAFRPGYRLPPLMLDDDEAVAVVLGLIGARGPALEREPEPVDGALAKILRVLPAPLRSQVEALEQTLGFTATPSGVPVGRQRGAAARRRDPPPPARCAPAYRSFSGERSRRELSPHGLVVHAGRWYLAAHDHGRDDLRTFRVDRMSGARAGRTGRDRSARGLRRGRAREPLARPRALDLGGRGAARSPGRPGRRAPAAHARGACAGRASRRSCACASTRSTGWPACSPAWTARSRSARRTSCARACRRSPSASRPAPRAV